MSCERMLVVTEGAFWQQEGREAQPFSTTTSSGHTGRNIASGLDMFIFDTHLFNSRTAAALVEGPVFTKRAAEGHLMV